MPLNLWSDEDRLFIPRLGGWSINFKYVAKKLGWVKPSAPSGDMNGSSDARSDASRETREDRLKRAVERSRYEDEASS
jgi:hypothetical protein